MNPARAIVGSCLRQSRIGITTSWGRYSHPFATIPPVGCSHWVRAISSSNNREAADFCDDIDIGETEDAEEVSEGIFISQSNVPIVRFTKSFTDSRPRPPSAIKQLNRLLSRHVVPDLLESDLDEKFVRGRGPGGQAINKTNSSVCLTHIPTGIRVQAQPTRSREQNRQVARQILKERLDLMRARGELVGEKEVFSGLEPTPGTIDDSGQANGQSKISRKDHLATLARTWSKQELRWEKERRRKLNRAKKVKRREKEEET